MPGKEEARAALRKALMDALSNAYDQGAADDDGDSTADVEKVMAAADAYAAPPAVRIPVTVTVEMTAEQREAYAQRYGVGFVEIEVKARLRQSLKAADLAWLDGLATVTMTGDKGSPAAGEN